MPACDACGTNILFGGVRDGTFRFCNANCAQKATWLRATQAIPDVEVARRAREIQQSDCPKCGGPGPVEIHTSHKVFSALAFTRWSSHPEVCCHSCGQAKYLKHGAFSMLLGWWGFPWGIIMTPVQVGRNIGGYLGMDRNDPEVPSPALHRFARLSLAGEPRGPSATGRGNPSEAERHA